MSSSPVVSTDKAKREERRRSSREVLNHYVVLVYFGEDNWGKLTNMSENGMAFEFSRPPALHERVNFTFQVMGCMPVPQDASVLGESFEAAGEIVWLREFERIAGVHFVELAEGNRKHIRQWMTFEASTNPLGPPKGDKEEVLPTATETTESPVALTPLPEEPEAVSQAETKESLAEPEPHTPESLAEREEVPESLLTLAMLEDVAPALAERDETVLWQPNPKSAPSSQPSVARLTFLVVAGCLAAFAATAGVRIFMTRASHRAEAAENALGSPPAGEPAGEATVSSSGSSPVVPGASAAEAGPPFQVEVLDASGKRWMLWFVHSDSQKGSDQISRRVGTESPTSATKRKDAAEAETPHTFTLEAPNINRPGGGSSQANNPAEEAPAIQTDSAVSQEEPMGGALGSRVTPPAPAVNTVVGGMVQMARLIHQVPPAYPAIAKSTHVSGDVVVDALIDANGNVKTAKVLSGPAMLQQAAIETVRQWKYEPARLDGQAVAMHLTVTVKFRLN
ncbi:MAG: TonB family protein [Acidobacteriota bacterium]|nr:TonB family protein [Acidobacteriota bacterium]